MTTPDRFFSPAETSRRLEVSVRALRLYERRGLVRPQRTAAGWRVYGPVEITRLHQVLALKSLGLSLTRVAGLMSGREGGLDAVLAVQEQALSLRKAELERALKAIRQARDLLAADQTLSLDDLATLARETRMNTLMNDEEWETNFAPLWRKHLTLAGFDKMFSVAEAVRLNEASARRW